METAIVTGATGFVGAATVNQLLTDGIRVLAIGRREWDEISSEGRLHADKRLTYLQYDMNDIETLPDKIADIDWTVGDDCVFYNFAWEGM